MEITPQHKDYMEVIEDLAKEAALSSLKLRTLARIVAEHEATIKDLRALVARLNGVEAIP